MTVFELNFQWGYRVNEPGGALQSASFPPYWHPQHPIKPWDMITCAAGQCSRAISLLSRIWRSACSHQRVAQDILCVCVCFFLLVENALFNLCCAAVGADRDLCCYFKRYDQEWRPSVKDCTCFYLWSIIVWSRTLLQMRSEVITGSFQCLQNQVAYFLDVVTDVKNKTGGF